jgi:shikimate dehydrogenase
MKLKLFGLIGYPLTHSFSQKYFSEKFVREKIDDCEYRLFPIENISEIPKLIELIPELQGFNVTIPYKEQVKDILNEIDFEAKEIGAVNTVKIIQKNNKLHLKGYNTDVYGFSESLTPFLNGNENLALILGTGGASKAVQYSLKKLNINYTLVSRSPYKEENTIFYSEITKEIIENHQIIINTTPLGMYPDIFQYPEIPYEFINENHIMFDLIYNPKETQFLKFGKYKNAKIINGLEMLYLQAEKSWEIFTS